MSTHGQRQAPPATAGSGFGAMLIVSTAYYCLMLWAACRSMLPWWIFPASLALNLLTFWVYWTDKHAAQTGQWRTPENTLQLLALAGGWPGGWLAQQVLRHKSRKKSFRMIYWLMVLAHGLPAALGLAVLAAVEAAAARLAIASDNPVAQRQTPGPAWATTQA